MTNRIQTSLNKKAPTVSGSDALALSRLSKAALLDIAIEALRLNAGSCDSEIPIEQLREMVNPALEARGDRKI